MRWPLFTQLLAPMAGVILAAVAGVSALNAWFSTVDTRRNIEDQLREVVATLNDANFPLNDTVLRQTSGLSGAEFVIVDEKGVPQAASRDDIPLPPKPWVVVSPDELSLVETATVKGESYYHVAVALKKRTPDSPGRTLWIFYPYQQWYHQWSNAVIPPLLVGATTMVLAILLAAVIAAKVTRPIHRLQDQVDRIAQGDFEPISAPVRNDEIRDLAESINDMARMLARYEEEVRRNERLRTLGQLGGGIAHRIRNSLTGCSMAIELHRRECPIREDCESLDVASRQLVLMERYVERFLTLGRSREKPHVEVDVCILAENVADLVRPTAQHTGVAFTFERPDDSLLVSADGDALEQLVVNLVLNACEATETPGATAPETGPRVTLCVRRHDDDRVIIEVTDTGPGPSPDVSDTLFEPLVTTKPDGTGLGLAVARTIVEEHHGTLAFSREEGKTIFTVELPLLRGE